MTEYFTKTDIPAIGTKIKTLREFSGIPEDTIGTVIGIYQHDKMTYGVDIRWNRWENDRLTDGFSKGEYYQYLQEIP
jgi:hypothetical protein